MYVAYVTLFRQVRIKCKRLGSVGIMTLVSSIHDKDHIRLELVKSRGVKGLAPLSAESHTIHPPHS